MKTHKCNCSDLLISILNRPVILRVDSIPSGYVITDINRQELQDDIEITIIGTNATWKIKHETRGGPDLTES